MASPAQCFYCFETLAASFKNEEPPSLAAIESSYWHFSQSKQLTAMEDRALAEEEEDNEEEEEEESGHNTIRSQTTKLPPVTRLRQDASSDSSSTTTLSANSSRSALSNSTNLTTPDDSLRIQRNTSAEESYPLFVTWNLISRHGNKSLRGCIGTFEAKKLSYGLKEYALISAFDDTRFSPIPSSQLPSLSCSLTLLGNFEHCADAMDWELGKHGLRISFIHRNRRHGATYLPDVPVEQGWTKEETVESLMRKGGWDGGSSGVARRILRGGSNTSSGSKPWEEVTDFKATRYQGLQASADYSDWQEWRKWVQADESRLELLQQS